MRNTPPDCPLGNPSKMGIGSCKEGKRIVDLMLAIDNAFVKNYYQVPPKKQTKANPCFLCPIKED